MLPPRPCIMSIKHRGTRRLARLVISNNHHLTNKLINTHRPTINSSSRSNLHIPIFSTNDGQVHRCCLHRVVANAGEDINTARIGNPENGGGSHDRVTARLYISTFAFLPSLSSFIPSNIPNIPKPNSPFPPDNDQRHLAARIRNCSKGSDSTTAVRDRSRCSP